MWQSGTGMAADAQGKLYGVTGDGTVGDAGDPTSPTNRGESALKLTPAGSSLHVASYFTPQDFQFLNDNDVDYGTMGGFLIPNSLYFLTGGKDGNRSEEHTSELQSRLHLVCRLLLEKKKKKKKSI